MQRFSSGQITVLVVAVCLAITLAPVGVMAATGQLVNITDPVNTASKARVDGSKLRVGDGDGAMSVDGRVAAAMSVPGRPFAVSMGIAELSPDLVVVKRKGKDRLALTSAVLSNYGSFSTKVQFYAFVVDDPDWDCNQTETATLGPDPVNFSVVVPANDTVNVTWPSPVVAFELSRAGSTSCLMANDVGPAEAHHTSIMLSGFWAG